MVRIFFLTAALSCLGACTNGPFNGGVNPSWSTSAPVARAFRFDWRLSGDPAVAPLQVFDDGKDVWLQFPPGQALPAIFGVRGNGEHALPYVRREPYVVVSGDWHALRFRGGRLAARAERDADNGIAAQAPVDAEPVVLESATPRQGVNDQGVNDQGVNNQAVNELASNGPLRRSVQAGSRSDAPIAQAPLSATESTLLPAPQATLPVAAAPQATLAVAAAPQATPAVAAAPRYRAAPPDTTLRGVLARWADSSGWTFAPQHWAVDVDIPLSASADFAGDFKSAVRELLGATELADRPLQPCFYGNQVLRVVPLAQSCTRAATPAGGGA
ncbi:TcpQ domain-containing protein [Achromobacter kerstersii]|uniref:TcpQ domain-containing protein n=1 Tax=Achromobacter kerstersii TaxID=1353890 RepID=UPI0006C2CF96|nr:TcpQ domain-containing protein [Achromobacter kerstersii]CUJ64194.1 Type IV secretory pathway%2C VirB9 components [Achromobacter kerstersii]